jgi:hypothetical protein
VEKRQKLTYDLIRPITTLTYLTWTILDSDILIPLCDLITTPKHENRALRGRYGV